MNSDHNRVARNADFLPFAIKISQINNSPLCGSPLGGCFSQYVLDISILTSVLDPKVCRDDSLGQRVQTYNTADQICQTANCLVNGDNL